MYAQSTCPDDPALVLACGGFSGTSGNAQIQGLPLTAGTTYLVRVGSTWSFTNEVPAALEVRSPTSPGFAERCARAWSSLGCGICPCGPAFAPSGTRTGCLNSTGVGARLLASGYPSVSLPAGDDRDLRFRFTGLPASSFAVLSSGDALLPTNPADPCFGMGTGIQSVSFDGLRCVASNVRRHGGRPADTDGQIGYLNAPWGGEGGPPAGIANAGAGFVSGDTRYFQATYRDDPTLSCMTGLNTSQAVEVTFTP